MANLLDVSLARSVLGLLAGIDNVVAVLAVANVLLADAGKALVHKLLGLFPGRVRERDLVSV
jgi:hypothetical protein